MKHRIIVLIAGALLAFGPPAMAGTIELSVRGLVCAFCAQGIEKKLRKNAATADVLVSLDAHLVAVALKAGTDIPDSDLRRMLTDAGYTVVSITRNDESIDDVRARLAGTKP